ncbi:unnamed protein product [Allacma fusca]|uniref:Protein msta n=1 Tax=Allacma fusca TaxID=39272 RepID=A0A8J2LPE8_9HEXA|nr:unnamed protein product [Allacma fusca]
MELRQIRETGIPSAYLKTNKNISPADHPSVHLNQTNVAYNAFEVMTDSETGKYIVATRDLEPGEVVVEEGPLAYSPVNFSVKDNCITCITCGKTVETKAILRCLKCKWPFCSARCQWHKSHTGGECEMFTFKDFKYEQLSPNKRDSCYVILMIRTFRLSQQQPDLFRELMSLVEATPDNFSDHESLNKIMRLCNTKGISTNIFHPKPERTLTFVYSKASLFAQSCAPNCKFTPVPTYKRQQKFISRMGQPCKCRRCNDPTEFGTYISAISCRNCQNLEGDDTNLGYLLSHSPSDIGKYSTWRCNLCGGMQLASKFLPKVEVILDQLKSKEIRYEKMLLIHKFLRFCNTVINGYQRTFLHPNHWLLQEATHGILKHHNVVVTRVSSKFGVEQLDLYISHYEYLLAIQDRIFPGLTLQRAYLQRKLSQMVLFKILKAPDAFEPKELSMEIERCRKMQLQVFQYYVGHLFSQENPSFQLNEFILEMHVASSYSTPEYHH